MVDYFSTTADTIKTEYEDFVNGIYIRNPGNSDFKIGWNSDVFSIIHSKGLQVGIEGYANKFNAESAQLVDLVVTFKDDILNFNSTEEYWTHAKNAMNVKQKNLLVADKNFCRYFCGYACF